MKVKLSVLTSDDCFQCQRCCRFDPDEFVDAPLFTSEQRTRAEQEFGAEACTFMPRGEMWQVVLREIPGSQKRMCPFYEESTARCKVYAYGVFDCDTWPFYIMQRQGRLVLTLSRDCPVIDARDAEALRSYAHHHVAPQMLAAAARHPELVAAYREGVVELLDLGECAGSDRSGKEP